VYGCETWSLVSHITEKHIDCVSEQGTEEYIWTKDAVTGE